MRKSEHFEHFDAKVKEDFEAKNYGFKWTFIKSHMAWKWQILFNWDDGWR